MEIKKENILKVQREPGRGHVNLQATAREGNHQWCFPAKRGQKEYEVVLEWVAEGNQILPPPPKYVDPNRGPWAYRENSEFRLPDESTSVWRYMSLLKFISLLNEKALFFTRGTIMANEDWREGALPKPNKDGVFGELKKKVLDSGKSSKNLRMIEMISLGQKIFKQSFNNAVLINCWSKNDYESKAMWDSYGREPISVAIKTNIASLKNCFGSYVDYDIFIGEVSYINHETDEIVESNPIISPFLYKGKFYDTEREVRCVLYDDGNISLFPEDEPNPHLAAGDNLKMLPGINVPVDLDILIDELYLSPQAPNYSYEIIKSLLKNYGLSGKDVLFSQLNNESRP